MMPTVYSARLGAHLHLGKRPAQPPDSSHVQMSDLLAAIPAGTLPPIPEHFGHGYDFTGNDGADQVAGAWNMLANGPDNSVFDGFQGCGCCAWAGPAHEEMEAAKNAGRPVPQFSGATIVKQYSEYSGYDPKTGANDNGSDVQDVLKWRQTKGLLDNAGTAYKIGQTVSLTPGDMTELWAAAYLFETVGIGVNLQAAQMTQFDSGQPWDYVHGSPVQGGHYIPVVGKTGLVSWGMRVAFTPAFIEHQCDEAFCYVDGLRYSALTDETAEGLTASELAEYAALIVQQKSGQLAA